MLPTAAARATASAKRPRRPASLDPSLIVLAVHPHGARVVVVTAVLVREDEEAVAVRRGVDRRLVSPRTGARGRDREKRVVGVPTRSYDLVGVLRELERRVPLGPRVG